MPVTRRKAAAPHNHPALAVRLAEELRSPHESCEGGWPAIIEDEDWMHGRNVLEITVVWEAWADLPSRERGMIVLDAYRQVHGDATVQRIHRVVVDVPANL